MTEDQKWLAMLTEVERIDKLRAELLYEIGTSSEYEKSPFTRSVKMMDVLDASPEELEKLGKELL